MNIEIFAPSDLKPYEKNPRINDEAVDAVAKSIEKFGFNQPVVCNQDKIICVGHTRWKAAQKLGLKTIPVYVRKMSEAEFIAYNVADNRTAENAKWDDELLSELLNELDSLDDNFIEYTGFSDKELDALLDEDDIDGLIEDEEQKSGGSNGGSGQEKPHVKMVQLFFDDVSFPKFIGMCEKLQAKFETSNLTDTVYEAVKKMHEK